jgi:hypothetical protein
MSLPNYYEVGLLLILISAAALVVAAVFEVTSMVGLLPLTGLLGLLLVVIGEAHGYGISGGFN